jgi:predicted acetyltransferase
MNREIAGKIWVDNVSNPKSALLIDNIWAIYLLGDSNNKNFNKQAGVTVRNYVLPRLLADEEINREWILVYDSNSWVYKIQSEFELDNWFQVDIWHYRFEQLKHANWRDDIPDNFQVEKLDEDFISKTHLINHEHITSWVYKRWKTPEDFIKRGFCFCLVKGDEEIVSWAMSDWSTDNYILMGCTTDENHREKGYATIVTSAAAEYYMSKNIDLRWFCAAQNFASRETAETVGFEKIREKEIIIGEFD